MARNTQCRQVLGSMTRYSLVAWVSLAVACSHTLTPLHYTPPLASTNQAAKATLVVTLPFDDRYLSEKRGESPKAAYVITIIAWALVKLKGNSVTGDTDLALDYTEFGKPSVAGTVGQALVDALRARRLVERVLAHMEQAVKWGPDEEPSIAAVTGIAQLYSADYVLVPRLIHMYGLLFQDFDTAVQIIPDDDQTSRHHHDDDKSPILYETSRTSLVFGNCAMELLLYHFVDGKLDYVFRKVVKSQLSYTPDKDTRISELQSLAEVTTFGQVVDLSAEVVRGWLDEVERPASISPLCKGCAPAIVPSAPSVPTE